MNNLPSMFKEKASKQMAEKDELKLLKDFQNGDQAAFEKLYRSYIKLIMKIAIQNQIVGIDIEDLLQAGRIGLWNAAKNSKRKRNAFRTYAYQRIKSTILDFLRQNGYGVVSIPSREQVIMNKKNALLKQMGKKPTIDDILDVSKLRGEISIDRVQEILDKDDHRPSYVSNEELIQDSEAEQIDIKIDVEKLLFLIPEQERKIISIFYGINCKRETIPQIAKQLGYTNQRVWRAIHRGLNRLRAEI